MRDALLQGASLRWGAPFYLHSYEGRTGVARPYTEQQVLKKLDIPDFRHLTKEKVIAFATMVPKMNPEVAKKALEQFELRFNFP